jgi:alpha-glucosidase
MPLSRHLSLTAVKTTLSAFLIVLLGLAMAMFAMPASALPNGSWTVTAPSGSGPAGVVTLTNGNLTFSAQRNGATVLSPASIGINTSVGNFTSGLDFNNRSDQVRTQTYTMPTGKQRSRSVTYNEMTLSFTGGNGAPVNLVVRAGGEGVAYRWVLPETGTISVSSETAQWTVPSGSPAWVNDYALDYQGPWRSTTAGGAAGGSYAYPALFNVGGTYVSIAESDIDGRYTASLLNHSAGSGTYTTSLESQVTSTGPLSTAWRIAAVGDLGTVTASRMVDDMAQPSRIADTSWIRPGKVAWSWLTQGTGDVNLQRQYVDFAQQNGWPYNLVDAGWSSSWFPDLVNYASTRNVGIILWYDSSELQTDAQLQQLQTAKNWGVVGVKIDYVFDHNQSTMRWFDKVLQLTADLHLLVNFHGTEMTRGMQRTWPHVMTSEAVYGAEQKQGNASFDTILPYTRNQVSSMDFTGVVFSTGMGNTTRGHQLGQAVAFESGWQHFADNPASYNSQPLALAILNKTPTAWDETRFLGGTPGQEVYLARRYGNTWFVGGLSAVGAKTFTTPLSFLGGGQYFVETVRDGSGGTLTRDTGTVTSGSTLSVAEATNGGFVSVICPFTSGMTTCPNPSGSMNDFSLGASPGSGSVNPGGSVSSTVTASLTGGSAQTVNLSASGLPGGATASFSPSSVSSAGGSSTLTISTSASTPAGTYTVTVTGTGSSATRTTTFTLTVNGGGGGCTATNGNDVTIPDLSTVESTITISGCAGNASGTSTVEVHIQHTWIGDLVVDLVAPDGSVYNLHNRAGGATHDINQTYTVNLSPEVANGIWRLRVQDAAAIDTGIIDTWTLRLGSGTPGPCTATNGNDVQIPDVSTVNSPITISGCTGNASATSTVEVHIVHTWTGDLIVSLIAPDGSAYVLRSNTGGDTDNIDQTFTVNLTSETRNGTWNLRVQDTASLDTGYINSWTLTL